MSPRKSDAATKCDIAVAGHICFDVIPDLREHGKDFLTRLVPGRLIGIGDVTTSTGGPVSNTGIALRKLGVATAFMGKVGRDFFGQAVIDRLRQYGADRTMAVVDGEATSYTLALAPPGIDRIFLHNPGVNHTFGLADVNFDIVATARHFHLGYPPLMRRMYADGGRELAEIFRRAKDLGVTTSLDMSLPDAAGEAGRVDWAALLATVLPHVDIHLPSVEETLFMLNRPRFDACKAEAAGKDVLDFIPVEDVDALGRRVLEMGAKVAILKSGHRGMYLRTGDRKSLAGFGRMAPADEADWSRRQLWEPSFHVPQVASATGSGDSSIAGFLAALARGLSCESCLKYACAVGGFNVTAFDAVSGIRSWEETTQAIPGWRKNDISITARGWRHDEARRVWVGPDDSVLAREV